MTAVFRNPVRRINPANGKEENVVDESGKQLFHPKWRTTIVTHQGRRKTYIFGANKIQAPKQAYMIEQREREIKMGIRTVPTPQNKNQSRQFDNVLAEYMAWGRAQGGRKGMPWEEEHAYKKERDISFWRDALELKLLGDLYGILPKVEERCRAMLDVGNTGKTVANKVLNLRSLILWCKKRKTSPDTRLRNWGSSTRPRRRSAAP